MFGHQDQTTGKSDDAVTASVDAMLASSPSDQSATAPSDPTTAPTAPGPTPATSDYSAVSTNPGSDSETTDAVSSPPAETPSSPAPSDDGPTAGSGYDSLGYGTSPPASAQPGSDDSAQDLLDIKQDALQQLWPLVDHLDQTPEEKFRTTMMMIQGTDDQTLIKSAYEAAQKVTDEKARAQALLDVVNEINYFTHK